MFEDESTGNEHHGFVERAGHRVLLSTAPDEETATRLARALVDSGAAGSVSIVPRARTFYRFQGKLEESSEVMIVVRTTVAASANAAEILRREHPYDCPEVIAVDVAGGLDAYLSWLSQGTGA